MRLQRQIEQFYPQLVGKQVLGHCRIHSRSDYQPSS